MNLSPWTLYWITRLDNFQGLAVALMVVSLIAIGLLTILLVVDSEERDSNKFSAGTELTLRRLRNWSIPALVVSMLIMIFVPSTKEMAVITVVPAIANNEKVQKEATELYDLAKDYLKKTLK